MFFDPSLPPDPQGLEEAWDALDLRGAVCDEPEAMHQAMAAALDEITAGIRRIQDDAREGGSRERPRWPMIVLRTPKGWTGPKEVDGLPVEGT